MLEDVVLNGFDISLFLGRETDREPESHTVRQIDCAVDRCTDRARHTKVLWTLKQITPREREHEAAYGHRDPPQIT